MVNTIKVLDQCGPSTVAQQWLLASMLADLHYGDYGSLLDVSPLKVSQAALSPQC
jgi:hypothetical protein